jgi:hypothetical protein
VFHRFSDPAQLGDDSFVFLSARIQSPHYFLAGSVHIPFVGKLGFYLLQAGLRACP